MAVQLIQRSPGVAGAVAASESRIDPDVLHHFHTGTRAETLEKIFVEQARPQQLGVKGWNVAEIGVVEIEFDAGIRLQTDGEETTADACAGCCDGCVTARTISLRRMIDREIPLVENPIFEEHERAIDF